MSENTRVHVAEVAVGAGAELLKQTGVISSYHPHGMAQVGSQAVAAVANVAPAAIANTGAAMAAGAAVAVAALPVVIVAAKVAAIGYVAGKALAWLLDD